MKDCTGGGVVKIPASKRIKKGRKGGELGSNWLL